LYFYTFLDGKKKFAKRKIKTASARAESAFFWLNGNELASLFPSGSFYVIIDGICNSGSFSSIPKKKALPARARLINSFRVQNIGT